MAINEKPFKIKNALTGEIHAGMGRKKFCLKHNLDPSLFSSIFTGRVKSHKGFCLVSSPFIHRKIRLINLKNNIVVEGSTFREVAKKLNVNVTTVSRYIHGKNKKRFKQFVRVYEKHSIRQLFNLETGKIYTVTNISEFCKEHNLPEKSIYYLFNNKKVKEWRNWRVVGQPNYFKYRITDKKTGKVFEGVKIKDILSKIGVSYNSFRYYKNRFTVESFI